MSLDLLAFLVLMVSVEDKANLEHQGTQALLDQMALKVLEASLGQRVPQDHLELQETVVAPVLLEFRVLLDQPALLVLMENQDSREPPEEMASRVLQD